MVEVYYWVMFKKFKKAGSIAWNINKYALWSYNQFLDELITSGEKGFSNNKKRAAMKIIREIFEGDNEIIQKFRKSMAVENKPAKNDVNNDYIDTFETWITDQEIARDYGLNTKAYQYDPAYSGLSPFDETTGYLLMQENKPSRIMKETFLEREIDSHRKQITRIKKELKILQKKSEKEDKRSIEISIEIKKQRLEKMNDLLPRLKRDYILLQAGMGSSGFRAVMKRIGFILPNKAIPK